MKRGRIIKGEIRTKIKNPEDSSEEIFLTDNANGRFNTEYGNAFAEIYGKKIPSDRYSICHIGGNTAYNIKTFAAIPNVVYAPTWIERVTDDSPEVRRFLATRSYELYGETIKNALVTSGKTEDEAIEQLKELFLDMQSPREGLEQEVDAIFPPQYQDEADKEIPWKNWKIEKSENNN